MQQGEAVATPTTTASADKTLTVPALRVPLAPSFAGGSLAQYSVLIDVRFNIAENPSGDGNTCNVLDLRSAASTDAQVWLGGRTCGDLLQFADAYPGEFARIIVSVDLIFGSFAAFVDSFSGRTPEFDYAGYSTYDGTETFQPDDVLYLFGGCAADVAQIVVVDGALTDVQVLDLGYAGDSLAVLSLAVPVAVPPPPPPAIVKIVPEDVLAMSPIVDLTRYNVPKATNATAVGRFDTNTTANPCEVSLACGGDVRKEKH